MRYGKNNKNKRILLEKARYFLNQHLATTIVSTVDDKGWPRAALFASPTMIDDLTIGMACSDFQKTYTNLKINPYAFFLVVKLRSGDYLDYDGVEGIRILAKLIKNKKSGKDFMKFKKELASRGYDMTNYLIFKVIDIHPIAFLPKK